MSGIEAGFTDPVLDAQAIFRAALTATAHPGRIVRPAPLPPPAAPLNAVTTALLLTLADLDTPVWLDAAADAPAAQLRFHCGCPITATPETAAFAVVAAADALPPLDAFTLGSDEAPETAATVIVEVAALASGDGLRLWGPGIDGAVSLAVDGLPARFFGQRGAIQALFPRGLDVLLTTNDALVGLPRTTRIED